MSVRNGYICSGIFDKNHAGPGKFGIVAAVEEIYGGKTAGDLLSGFARMFTHFWKNYRGFTLGIKDVTTKPAVRKERKVILEERIRNSRDAMVNHYNIDPG